MFGDKLFYLNDSSGYYNLYEARFDSTVSHIDTTIHYRYYTTSAPLTDYSSSIIDYSFNPRSKQLVMLFAEGNGHKVYSAAYRPGEQALTQMNPYAQKRLLEQQQQAVQVPEKTTTHRFKNSYRTPRRKTPPPTPTDSTEASFVNRMPVGPIRGVEPDYQPKQDTTLRSRNYYE